MRDEAVNGTPEQREQLASIFKKWETNAALFVRKALGWHNIGGEKLKSGEYEGGRWAQGSYEDGEWVPGPPRPTSQQASLLNAVSVPDSATAVRSGHGTGKSTALAWLILWFVSVFGDCKVPCTAPTLHQLEDVLFAEVRKWADTMHPALRKALKISTLKVEVVGEEKTRFAVARTARKENPDALQGFHATNILIIVDEASGVPEPIFNVLEGALSTKGARVALTGNPTRNSGYFFESFHKHAKMWTCLHFDSRKSPRASAEYNSKMLEKYGVDNDIFRIRVAGEFPNASERQLITMSMVESAQNRHLDEKQYKHAPIIIGCDPAWYGSDRSVVYLRQGLYAKKLFAGRDVDNMWLAGFVNEQWDIYGADACFIDMGWGAGVVDRLKQLGKKPVHVAFGGRATKHEEYHDKRAEMWWTMRDWLHEAGGCIPEHDELKTDLTAPEYAFTAKSKKALESKDEIKKRGLDSPDEGDALALTFAFPVTLKSDAETKARSAGSNIQTSLDKDFDVFAPTDNRRGHHRGVRETSLSMTVKDLFGG
jgi:hypothetical protein